MDKDYWKEAYQFAWDGSSKRELALAQWVEGLTGRKVEISGLGAGTTDFISGSAADNGYDKGDADLHIADTPIYIEVTGPLSAGVPEDAPLWFRPDKFNNAVKSARTGHDTFFAHHCPSADLWRVIHIDPALIQRLYNPDFQVVTPLIRGRTERYVEVPAGDPCVKPLRFLERYLLEKLGGPHQIQGGNLHG